MMMVTLKNEKTGAVEIKKIADGDYKNLENIAKGLIRGWARKLVREEWIASGKLIVGEELGDERFKDGFGSDAMKNAVSEFEKNVSWKLEKEA